MESLVKAGSHPHHACVRTQSCQTAGDNAQQVECVPLRHTAARPCCSPSGPGHAPGQALLLLHCSCMPAQSGCIRVLPPAWLAGACQPGQPWRPALLLMKARAWRRVIKAWQAVSHAQNFRHSSSGQTMTGRLVQKCERESVSCWACVELLLCLL